MKNYISINGKKTQLTPEQLEKLKAIFTVPETKLADIPVGGVFTVEGHQMIVLEQFGDTTLAIRKDLLPDQTFGENNNFAKSEVLKTCDKFADEIAAAVGAENIVKHDLDLTANDGLKDYGILTERRASLLTADMYRKYVLNLDKFNPEQWWWLATPDSTKTHKNDRWTLCVAPSGYVIFGNDAYRYYCYGVRPFLILKSSIFESLESGQ